MSFPLLWLSGAGGAVFWILGMFYAIFRFSSQNIPASGDLVLGIKDVVVIY